MYDRKTWIVVALCSALLAANLYFSGKTRQEEAARRAAAAPPPVQPATPATPAEAAPAPGVLEQPPAPPAEERLATLETEGARFTLTTLGGGVKSAAIKDQFEVGSSRSLVTLNSSASHPVGTLSDGADRSDGLPFALVEDESVPGQRVVFRAVRDGLEFTKSFARVTTGEPGADYLLDLELTVRNTGAAAQPLDRWTISLGTAAPLYQKEWENQTGFFWRRRGSFGFTPITKFKGGWFGQEKSVLERALGELEYAGVSNQFFATVLKPAAPADSGIWARTRPDIRLADSGGKSRQAILAGMRLPAVQLAPGASHTASYRLFMGPKLNRMLRKMGPDYADVMNYGWFSWFSRILNFTLFWIHEGLAKLSGKWSWGLAIIVLTIVVRAAMWPLQNASTRTMKRMSKLKPEMDRLKVQYPDDPNRLNQEVMKLYRRYHINPMGGCLPMLVQIPIFFGFYRMLQYAVELRDKGFLWVADLSQPDTVATIAGIPLNLLPIVMGATSFLQIAMTPKTGDKTQQRIMLFMPLMFFFFCYSFASALALYWTTSNLFAIVQTWFTNRLPEPQLKERKGGPRKSWVERLADRQEQMRRIQRDRTAGPAPAPDDKGRKKRPPRTGG